VSYERSSLQRRKSHMKAMSMMLSSRRKCVAWKFRCCGNTEASRRSSRSRTLHKSVQLQVTVMFSSRKQQSTYYSGDANNIVPSAKVGEVYISGVFVIYAHSQTISLLVVSCSSGLAISDEENL
jgi:hypothetical protein